MTETEPNTTGPRNGAPAGGMLQLVSFTVGGEEFGVDILRVQEINRMQVVTRVPNAPAYVDGVISLRGKVIPIVNTRRRLGIEPREPDKDTRIIVVELRGTILGLVVDAVSKVMRLSPALTEAPPSMVAGLDANLITAVGKVEDRLLLILDLDRLLTPRGREPLAEAV